MGHWRIKISLVVAISMTILHSSIAHNEPEDFLHAHGCIRRLLDIPPLVWDPELAKTAQAWADQRKDCKLTPSDKVGENMAQGPNLNASYAVQMWVEERPDYDHGKNECLPGTQCAHYTQVTWKNTERVGCGRAQCSDGVCYVIVCNYDPPGNIVGEKPY
ncbi:pathogenesis-related leaf protein 4 [Lactuca sativa]|uniref:pathogenesis-related leaf protein 4 n=1 Tax=Lactuca sativa TaxID=4236 RepID=UPI000CB0950F|nr:pathogenesis-related leaf protein 4 [Lactuca sativa]